MNQTQRQIKPSIPVDDTMAQLKALHRAVICAEIERGEFFENHFEEIHQILENNWVERKRKAKFQPWMCKIGDELQTHFHLYKRVK